VPQRVALRMQELATRKAKAFYEIARLNRELAMIAVEEYEEVRYPQDLATAAREVRLAEIDLKRSEDRLDWARRMFDKGYVSKAQKDSEERSLKKAVFAIEQAATKRKVLVDYTKGKTIKELKSEVDKARSDELAKEAAWNLEKAKQIELERLLGKKAN
jgi:HlyD family secretion protein